MKAQSEVLVLKDKVAQLSIGRGAIAARVKVCFEGSVYRV
jgi:hypothetical protein